MNVNGKHPVQPTRPDVVNHEGAPAHPLSPKMELYLGVVSMLWGEDSFYSEGKSDSNRLVKLMHQCGQEFCLRLANYARNRMNIRSAATVLLAEAASMPPAAASGGRSMVREYTPKVLIRADELATVLGYLQNSKGVQREHRGRVLGHIRALPAALKAGIADSFEGFDAYDFGKYKSTSGAVTLKDVIRIVHPKPSTQERATMYKQILDGTLSPPRTWEVYISEHGSNAEAWDAIAPDMGVFALVRNLRNFQEKDAQKAIQIAIERLTSRGADRKMFPYRLLAASKEISHGKLQDALRDAVELSLVNVPKFPGTTATFSDNSASMHSPVSAKSRMMHIEVGGLMSAIAWKLSGGEGVVGAFGEGYSDVPLSMRDSVLTNAMKVANANVGHSTNAWLAIESILKRKIFVDRIFIFSDMQCWNSHDHGWGCYGVRSLSAVYREYQQQINPNVKLYSFDLQGYGTSQFAEDDKSVTVLGGFSDKIFDFVLANEAGDPLEEIEKNW